MEQKLKLGTAYHGNRILRHIEEDMTDIVNHHMNTVVHMFTHNDMDRHQSVLKDIISISESKGLETWIDNWGIDDGPGDKAYITAKIPEAAQYYADGTRFWRPCFNHPSFRDFTKEWVEAVVNAGGKTLFWDEPHLSYNDVNGYACYCPTCQKKFEERYGHKMPNTLTDEVIAFRTQTLVDYFRFATDYANSCGLINTGCIMFGATDGISLDSIDRLLSLPHFDNVGCDPYWVHNKNVKTAQDIYNYNYTRVKKAVDTAKEFNKDSHAWIQSYAFPKGREDELFIAADAIYDAGARTIFTWSFRAGESNDYRAECCDRTWEIAGEAMRRIRDRWLDEQVEACRKNRTEK